jgi:hypothetical protein
LFGGARVPLKELPKVRAAFGRSFDLAFAIWRLLKIKIKKIGAFGSPYRYFVICVPRNSVKNLKKGVGTLPCRSWLASDGR